MLALAFLFIVLAAAAPRTVVLHLDKHVDPRAFAQEHGLTFERSLPNLPEHHAFLVDNVEHLRRRTRDNVGVLAIHVQTPRKQHKRSTDPLYSQQWHLPRLHADEESLTGRGITIAIVDDGFQHTHPDLQANYQAQWSHDYNDGDSDPTPTSPYDGHGTSAAGVAGAVQNNNHCGRGVAPNVKLVGVRSIAAPTSDYVESMAISHAYDHVDIYSCSWGPADEGNNMVEPGPLARATLKRMTEVGRNGKGSIYVWAGGNGRGNQDNCNYDGYANSPYTIAIGAIDYRDSQSWYSEDCAALMATAPSSGSGRGITTTDLVGPAGYDNGECTSTFGGTSSAAPLAAGVVALMLEARPDLTWRDVQHVIAKAATKVDDSIYPIGGGAWSSRNVRGYSHSEKYGFGILEIPPLIAEARRHQLVPPRKQTIPVTVRNGGAIPTIAGQPLNVQISVPARNANGITFIEHVELRVHLQHPHRGDVSLDLISPAGTKSALAKPRGDRHLNYQPSGWSFTTVRNWGESGVAGTWTARFYDAHPYNKMNGYVGAIELTIYGY
jgi:kexin